MLDALGGHTHEVVSGLCLRTPGWEVVEHEVTRVTFRPSDCTGSGRLRGPEGMGGTSGRVCHPGSRCERSSSASKGTT
jgi:hypothetical protein